MRQALEGDAVAYRRLLVAVADRLRVQLRARLVRWGATDVEAEDVVQETLLAFSSTNSNSSALLVFPASEAG